MKHFRCVGGAECLRFSIEHLVPESGRDIKIGYDTVVGGFRGDWYDAGDIYRDWAWTQWWCKTKWVGRPDVAQWAKQWPSMVKLDRYKKGSPAESYRALADMTRDFSQLLGQDIVTFFHGWGKNGWQMGAARRVPHPPWGGTHLRVRLRGARPHAPPLAHGDGLLRHWLLALVDEAAVEQHVQISCDPLVRVAVLERVQSRAVRQHHPGRGRARSELARGGSSPCHRPRRYPHDGQITRDSAHTDHGCARDHDG